MSGPDSPPEPQSPPVQGRDIPSEEQAPARDTQPLVSAYTPQEEEKVRARLRALGYL